MMLREVPSNPLDSQQREHLRIYRIHRSSFKTDTLYYENLEDKVRAYEALLALGSQFWPFPTESVHSYKMASIDELRRRARSANLPYRIIGWFLVTVGAVAAVGGVASLFLPMAPPVLYFALAVASAGYGGFRLVRDGWRLKRYEDSLRWTRCSLSSFRGALPPSFAATVEAVRAKVPGAYFEVESLDGGRYLLLTMPSRDRKYRLQEWHSNER